MKMREILSIIPRPARTIATALVCCGALIGPIAGYIEQTVNNGWVPYHGIPLPIVGLLIGLGTGVFIGALFALWVLCLGYVYGDARRRNMPAVPWTLVAALVPNLLGFLLYFVLRRSIASPCPRCGQAMTPEQRFCSWCGYQRPVPGADGFVPPSDPGGLNPAAPTQM